MPDIRFRMIAKYLALLCGMLSWIAVGKKIRIGRTIPRILNWVFLGPFNYVTLRQFTSRQHKVLWVGFILILWLALFPPWSAFKCASAGKGTGDSDFVGFRFLLSDQYDVLGTSPYVVAEIHRHAHLVLIAGVAICTSLSLVYLAKSPTAKGRHL